jgi:predicted enzyme related to lactoylglutathione lyase
MTEAIGTARWIVIDTIDPERLVAFWCALLGVERAGEFGPEYVLLTNGDGTVPPIAFQRVPEGKTGKNRVHLDITVEDVEEATRRVEELGGSRLGGLRRWTGIDGRWLRTPRATSSASFPRSDATAGATAEV